VVPADLELVPCDPARDGELIRAFTRANFYEVMKACWNEARHLQEPLHPENYRMVRRAGDTIGFFAVRLEPDHLYLQTIQLCERARNAGIGTRLLQHVRDLATQEGKRAIQLRVFRSNAGALRLYDRLGYVRIGEDEHSFVLELSLSA
jgi:ribosomal protein S18 acetylase RimI-like enzyme